MKMIRSLILVLTSVALLCGCDVTSDNPVGGQSLTTPQMNQYTGVWHLVSIGGHAPSSSVAFAISVMNSNLLILVSNIEAQVTNTACLSEVAGVRYCAVGSTNAWDIYQQSFSSDSNTIYLRSIRYSSVTQAIGTGALTGKVGGFGRNYFYANITSSDSQLASFVQSATNAFSTESINLGRGPP